jgi:hypothetical protein
MTTTMAQAIQNQTRRAATGVGGIGSTTGCVAGGSLIGSSIVQGKVVMRTIAHSPSAQEMPRISRHFNPQSITAPEMPRADPADRPTRFAASAAA